MKKLLLISALLGVQVLHSGCAGCANTWKEFHASTTGLHKKITLFSNDGKVLREWTTTTDTNDKGGSCMFLDKDGRYVRIAGTFVVEELP